MPLPRSASVIALGFPRPHRPPPRRHRAKPGPRSAGAVSGSTRPRRWRARNGWPSPRPRAWPPARGSSARRRSTLAEVEALYGDRFETRDRIAFDPATGGVTATRERRLGAIRLATAPLADPDPDAVAAALAGGRARARPRHPALVRRRAGPARPPRIRGRRRSARRRRAARPRRRMARPAAGRQAPPRSDHRPDRCPEGRARLGRDPGDRPPRPAAARPPPPAPATRSTMPPKPARPSRCARRNCSAWPRIPTVANGRVPLVLSLTSPAGRPIQTTRDLPGFWAGSWAAVAKEMRGRYPRHPWPDDPAAASATTRTKNADARRGGAR